jgi:hypothetical protein
VDTFAAVGLSDSEVCGANNWDLSNLATKFLPLTLSNSIWTSASVGGLGLANAPTNPSIIIEIQFSTYTVSVSTAFLHSPSFLDQDRSRTEAYSISSAFIIVKLIIIFDANVSPSWHFLVHYNSINLAD